ncbi:hypothetical protein ABLM61_RS01420 [Escherichia coli]
MEHPLHPALQPDTQFAEHEEPQPPDAFPVQPPEQLEHVQLQLPPQS